MNISVKDVLFLYKASMIYIECPIKFAFLANVSIHWAAVSITANIYFAQNPAIMLCRTFHSQESTDKINLG